MADERAGGSRPIVSPVRMPTSGSVKRHAEPLGREADARQRRAQVLLDVEREGPQRRDVEDPVRPARSGTGEVTSRSMPQRKAASVLPDPVGARISVCSPPRWPPALRLGGVGSGNEVANHSRTAGEKLARVTQSRLRHLVCHRRGRQESAELRDERSA